VRLGAASTGGEQRGREEKERRVGGGERSSSSTAQQSTGSVAATRWRLTGGSVVENGVNGPGTGADSVFRHA
jgi:hypothetical protein